MHKTDTKSKFPWLSSQTGLIAVVTFSVISFCSPTVLHSLSFNDGTLAFRPSSGVYLAIILLIGYRIVPAILISDFITNYFFYYHNILISSSIAVVELIVLQATAFFINRLIEYLNLLERSRNVFQFVVLLMLSTVVSSTLIVAILWLNNNSSRTSYTELWQTWYTSNFTGLVLITPTLLSLNPPSRQHKQLHRQQVLEFIFLLVLLIALSCMSFWLSYPLEHLIIPLLIWSAFRFGSWVTTLLMILVVAIAVFGTTHGFGALFKTTVSQSHLLLQTFICTVAVTTFSISAVINENTKLIVKLRKLNEELEQRAQKQIHEATNRSHLAKNEFFANISYEARTLLNGILGHAQIIQRSQSLTEKERQGINIIYQCGFYLLMLINNIEDTSTNMNPEQLEQNFVPFEPTAGKSEPVEEINFGLANELPIKYQPISEKIAEMVIPPISEITALYQAVQRCDVADIQAEINQIKQLDAKYAAFAEQVLLLADEFEVDAIAFLIEAHINSTTPSKPEFN